ncbi:MAG: AsmA family protein [Arenicellales bacterium]
MKSAIKLLLWLFGAAIVLLGTSLVWLAGFFEPSDYRDEIAQWVAERTGYHFVIEGTVSVGFEHQPVRGFFVDIGVRDVELTRVAQIPGEQQLHLSVLDFSADLGDLFASARGAPLAGKGRFDVVDADLRKLLANSEVNWDAFTPQAFRSVSATGDFLVSGDTLSLTDLEVSMDGTQISGNLEIENLSADPAFHFDLNVPSLHLENLLQLSAQGPFDGLILLNLPAILVAQSEVTGLLKIGTLQSGGVIMSDVVMPLRAHGGVIVSSPITADFYGGEARIDTVLRVDGALLDFRTHQQISQCRLGELLSDLELTGLIEARGSLSAKLAFSGVDKASRIQSARAVIEFAADQGRIKGLDLANLIEQLGRSAVGITDGSIGESAFTSLGDIRATLRVEDGLLINEDLAFQAGGLEVRGRGALALQSEQLDYRISLALNNRELASVLPPPFNSGMGMIVLPLRISGQWHAPSLMIDMPRMLQLQFQAAMGGGSGLKTPPVDARAVRLAKDLDAELAQALRGEPDEAANQ